MITKITSSANPLYKYLKSLKQKKNRMAEGVFTVEGERSVRDAVNAGYQLRQIAASESFYQQKQFHYGEYHVVVLSDTLFAGICDTKTPPGILAVCNISEIMLKDIVHGRYIYCDRVSDPGNVGTIIRTADAAGFDGVLLSEGCVDAYSPKTVRAGMGSFFHIPLITGLHTDDLRTLKQKGFSLLCGVLHTDSIDYRQAPMDGDLVVVIGNEANGVSEEIIHLCDTRVTIPMRGSAESLNAAVAASLLMYEAMRRSENGI